MFGNAAAFLAGSDREAIPGPFNLPLGLSSEKAAQMTALLGTTMSPERLKAGMQKIEPDVSFDQDRFGTLIARWPAVIAGGRTTHCLTCLTDIYPTLAEAAGHPHEPAGGEDGFSLMPVFAGRDDSGRETLVSHSVEGAFAIRHGRWKLCLCGGSGGWSAPKEPLARKRGLPPVQLFDLVADPAETRNLEADHPDVVADLIARLATEVRRGRSTPGPDLANDREVSFLPAGMTLAPPAEIP
jgi:hypothetical protein